jgi:hypothetical protein
VEEQLPLHPCQAGRSIGGGGSLHSKTSRQETGAYRGEGRRRKEQGLQLGGGETGNCARSPWLQQKRPGLMYEVRREAKQRKGL